MANFVPVNAAMFVNLDHIISIQVMQGGQEDDHTKTETALALHTDKHVVIARGNFARFILKTIGAEAHI